MISKGFCIHRRSCLCTLCCARYLAKRLSGLMDPTKVVGKPKIACLMSHVRLWEQLVCDPSPDAFYLILEDDVYVAADFHER